jgi:dihydroneopterin aldolase
VADEEQALGQRFVVDAAVTPLEADLSDELDRTVSYVSLMEVAEEVVTGRSFRLIESLAEAIAEEMLARFPVGRVWVRVGKPHAPVRFAVRGVFAEVELSRPGR